MAANLGDLLDNGLREVFQPSTAGHWRALIERAQGHRTLAARAHVIENEPLLLLRERQMRHPARLSAACRLRSSRDDLDDLVGVGVDDADLIIGDEVAIAAKLRNNGEHRSWQRYKMHGSWYARADIDREVHVVNAIDVPLLENGLVEVGPLLFRELHAFPRSALRSLVAGLRTSAALGSLLPGFGLRAALGSLLFALGLRSTLGSMLIRLSLCCTLAVFPGLRLRTLRAVLAILRSVAALGVLLGLRAALRALLHGLAALGTLSAPLAAMLARFPLCGGFALRFALLRALFGLSPGSGARPR